MDMYSASGVNYDVLDLTKVLAGKAAADTADSLTRHGAQEFSASRGQSAYVFQLGDVTLAFVLECLGTKSLLALKHQERTGENRWADIARDTVAAVVNDVITVGALPMVINAYFATGSDAWYDLPGAREELIAGWKSACDDSEASWGGGESPSLTGLVTPGSIELAGSAVARVPTGHSPLLGDDLQAGDEIVLIASSGIHANGISLARKLAEQLPDGFGHSLPSGRSLSDALLDPTVNYVRLVRSLLEESVPVSYLLNMTGHGLRKVMRADKELQYVLTSLPPVPEVLSEIVRLSKMEDAEAYATFNMGAGFAVMCRPGHAADVVNIAEKTGYRAIAAGQVQEGPRSVLIPSLDISYDGSTLQLK